MFTQITSIWTGKVALIAFFHFSPLCIFKCLLKLFTRIEVKSHSLHLFDFSPMCDFKCLLKQNRQSLIDCIFVCTKRAKVTFVAFIWLFSTVWFQMFSQISWITTGKVALIAFFYFSTLCIFKCLLKLLTRSEVNSH